MHVFFLSRILTISWLRWGIRYRSWFTKSNKRLCGDVERYESSFNYQISHKHTTTAVLRFLLYGVFVAPCREPGGLTVNEGNQCTVLEAV